MCYVMMVRDRMFDGFRIPMSPFVRTLRLSTRYKALAIEPNKGESDETGKSEGDRDL